MGETSVFECRACGYRSREVRWGVSDRDSRIRFLPALCTHCREVIEVDLTGRDVLIETFTCGECHNPVHFFEKARSHSCPRCGTENMLIVQKAYW